MSKNTALVVGGNGIVGGNIVHYLENSNRWDVIATSRSSLDYETTAYVIQLDLTDPTGISKHETALKGVTHVFFAAYIERKTLAEQTSANLALLKNLIDGLEPIATGLKHVSFIQGGKAYGAHLGRYKTPARENDPRHFPPNFYYDQEDYLRNKSVGKAWSFTALRPDIVIGFAVGNPMNLATIIAVYASFCRELGVAFRFPSTLAAYNAVVNITGADILAQGMEWAALHDKTGSEIFNITNGDVFRFSEAWPKIAGYFNVEIAEPLTFSLAEYMADKEPLWASMVKKHGLQPHTLAKLVQWPFGDFIFKNEHDAFFDVNKARRFGFHAMNLDSVDHMLATFDKMRVMKIIP
ncbi:MULTISPECIES: SDR family oxidoreductase [unclassified Nostoc]|uniref:SDR family oxidoreductase n=1 Tax=unclassified Nostoc TaxID=2593658 RepID=UPI0026225F3C|nr:SDR family oxidoreductase [Nostoc sp. S13]MDF5737800.1 SDR family oxidoreductase [Nostoc sp. S13]